MGAAIKTFSTESLIYALAGCGNLSFGLADNVIRWP
jgi:hypothetical protein